MELAEFTAILESEPMTVVFFTADECAACKEMEPIVRRVVKKYPDASILKIDAETDGEIAKHYDVAKLPTTFIFNALMPKSKVEGFMPDEDLENVVKSDLPR